MLRFILQRPIAVSTILIACTTISAITFFKIPISLLPNIDVPKIIISVHHPNGSPEEIEQDILKPIRESMLSLNGLDHLESAAENGAGMVSLHFKFDTKMNLAYIEASEKIDLLTNIFPKNLERPLVIKSNTSDIPIARIQVIPGDTEEDFLSTSELCEKIIKKRFEQLEGVGIVDINGLSNRVISVSPNYSTLQSLGLTYKDIIKTIEGANADLGAISVKEGNYRFSLKFDSKISNPKEIEDLSILLPNNLGYIKIKQVASIYFEPEAPSGFHLLGTRRALVITVHEQTNSKLPDLVSNIYSVVNQLKVDYPRIEFSITQDQSSLLKLSIQNLTQALILGSLFALIVLFLFMKGWQEPAIMGVVLPISLLLAFSLLYLFDISLNIISLSGLALGIGMLVDNSIVVIDSIMQKRKEGIDLFNSCISGTQEVSVPLISSTLTNIVVFFPLIFLDGLTGALFYDQAVSVAIILFTSVLSTFIVVPMLYLILFKNIKSIERKDSKLFIKIRCAYESSFQYAWNHKKTTLIIYGLLVPIAVILFIILPKQGFPDIERTETLIIINWNESIDAHENRSRITSFLNENQALIQSTEAEIGYQQFLNKNQNQSSIQQSEVYLKFRNQREKELGDQTLKKYFNERYPLAVTNFKSAPNAFEQIFTSDKPLIEAKFRDLNSKELISKETSDSLIAFLKTKQYVDIGKGFESETVVFIRFDFDKIRNYNIGFNEIVQQLKLAFGDYYITDLKNFGEITPIRFEKRSGDFKMIINKLGIESKNGVRYPLKEFLMIELKENFKNITADESGKYQSVNVNTFRSSDETKADIEGIAKSLNVAVDFDGEWFDIEKNIHQLTIILIVSLFLMYFILSAEFESLTQPMLVMLTIPIGLSGSFIFLWLAGGSINIMSGIGLVVVLGVLDNDAILKIDRINTLCKSLPLEQAIMQAGLDRLKPIVMNTCTNVLALVPILFSSGLGADLQRPIAITTIGGLIIGTFAALYLIPIMYWYLGRGNNRATQN